MVVRPRWPGEDTTPSASHDDSDAYSSPDEASPWAGDAAPVGAAETGHALLPVSFISVGYNRWSLSSDVDLANVGELMHP